MTIFIERVDNLGRKILEFLRKTLTIFTRKFEGFCRKILTAFVGKVDNFYRKM